MSYATKLLKEIRIILGGWDRWESEGSRPALSQSGKSWRVYCGEGRFDAAKRNGIFSKTTGIALNFQIAGEQEERKSYEMGAFWATWALMYHDDSERARDDHPRHHIQFATGADRMPFYDWRIPFGQTNPTEILRYFVRRIT